MSRMIDSMLFLAQAEQPDMAILRVELNARQEISRVSDYFEDLAAERNLQLVTEGEGQLYADALLVRRALANLVSNAVRYAHADSTVILRAEPVSDGLTFLVINRGDTLSPDHQKRLFDRFYRVDDARRDSATASGLGLSIVKSIMQLHKGRCWVESHQGMTTFGLFFPTDSADK